MSSIFVIVCVPATVALMAVTFVLAMSGFQETQPVVDSRAGRLEPEA